MKTYTITIDGKEVEVVKNGEYSGKRHAVSFKESKTIKTENLTKKNVLNVLKEMLYLSNEYNEEDLFDGNEDYFIFHVMENEEGYEARDEEVRGDGTVYAAEYFVEVELVEKVKATAIK
jgi:hypothetical protein